MKGVLVDELVNIVTRHQVYLERFKAGQVKETDALFTKLSDDLRAILLTLRLNDLSDITGTQGAQLVADIQAHHLSAYREHIAKLIETLKDLADFERDFEIEALDEATIDEVEHRGVPPLLWPRVTDRPMSATGELLLGYLDGLAVHEASRAGNLARRAIGEGWTINDLQSAFNGTKANRYSDGLFASSRRNTATTINTAVQHVSSATREGVMETATVMPKAAPEGSIQVDADGTVTAINATGEAAAKSAGIKVGDNLKLPGYAWVSVLDSKTSQQCRSLDGQTFPFGKGPLPPAHPNCRSSIVALILSRFAKKQDDTRTAVGARGAETVPAEKTYYEWLKDQPAAFQDDALGVTRATLFRKGGLSANMFASLNLGRNFQPLTLDEMRKLAPRAFKRAGL